MFNDLLKSAMKEAGMNATALSAATGIGKSSLSLYISGKIRPPEKRKEQIAVALGFDADYFEKNSTEILPPKGINHDVICKGRFYPSITS